MPNGKRTTGFFMLGLAALGIALFSAPEWAFDLPVECCAAAATFITLTGLTGAVVCFYQASAIYRVTSRDSILATWTVGGPVWREFLRHSLKTKYGAAFKFLLLFLALFFLFSIAFPLFGSPYAACLPVLLLVPAAALTITILFPLLWLIRMRLARGRMILAYHGIYCHGSFHTWSDPATCCKSLFLRNSPFHHLELTAYKTVMGRRKEKIYLLPVPEGRLKMVEETVAIFRMGMKK